MIADVIGALGLASLVVAGFTVAAAAGFAVLGAALVFVAWRVSQ